MITFKLDHLSPSHHPHFLFPMILPMLYKAFVDEDVNHDDQEGDAKDDQLGDDDWFLLYFDGQYYL